MKTIFRLLSLVLIAGLSTQTLRAQVKGISYTLSPSIEYSDWSESTGISDGYSVGGQLGFGFGQFVELRANYLQSINLERDFSNFDFDNFNNSLLAEQDVTVRRYGGELKVNLAKGGIVPFLTAGAGIQDVERSLMSDSTSTQKNIFFSGGGGIQFSLGDRYTLALQAVNTSFNSSPVRNLLDEIEQAEVGVDGVDLDNVVINNWSYRASILLYLGGRRPGEMTDTDKAYVENFSNGFRGLSLPIEVTAGQINFSGNLPYTDTKFTGVSSGFDFGPYVGLRAFYWRSMEDGYFSDFNRLAVYGGEGKFNLSAGQGVAPYLNVGGGVIDPLSGFEIDGTTVADENTPFVSGGLGLDLPFSRAFKLSGYAKALLTSNDTNTENIDPDELSTSMVYGLSANFIVGSRSKEARQITKNDSDSYDEMVANSMKREKGKADKLKKDYQKKIEELDEEIDEAYEEGNMELMEKKYQEREFAQRFVNRINKIEQKEAEANGENMNGMNPSEFKKMMEELKESQEKSQEQINERLDSIEKSLNAKNDSSAKRSGMTDRERELQKELDELKKRVDKDRSKSDSDSLSSKKSLSVNEESDGMSEREKELQKEVDKLKKQLNNAGSELREETSEREKELQREVDKLKKQLKKAEDEEEVSESEKELKEEVNKSKKQLNNSEDEIKEEISEREKELKKEAKKKSKNVKSEVSETERELEKEVEQLKKQLNEEQKNKSSEVDSVNDFRNSSNKNQDRNSSSVDFDENDVEMNMTEDTTVNYLTESQRNYESENLPNSGFFSNFNYDGASVLGGFNVGGSTTLNLGVRSHYRYKETDFFLMPEAFFGFGNPASFGLFANGIYELNLKNNNSFAPYAGAGFGVLNIGDRVDNRTKLAANFVIGANLFKVAGGRFYADLSARNLFNNNQLVAGYRLPF